MEKMIKVYKAGIAAVLMLLISNFNLNAQALSVSIISQTNVLCFGQSNGSATAAATGGAGGYNYSWAPGGATTATLSNVIAGTYTVTVTDALSAQATATVAIVQPSQLTVSSVNVAVCLGSGSSLCPTVSGGVPAYTFNWSPATSLSNAMLGCPTASPITTTVYTLTATDQNGCVAAATSTVTVNQNPTLSFSGPNTICSGSNLSMCANPNPPGIYTYFWSGPCGFSSTSTCATVNNITQVCGPWTFTLTITDMNGCSGTNNTTVIVASNPVASIVSHIEPSCAGSNGSLGAGATGGSAPYFYQWNTGNNTQVVSGLATGTYSVDVTDVNGCLGSVTYSLLDSCEVVWPGDADNDLTSNNNDILDIGLYYGNATNARPVQGNLWFGYPAQNAGLTKPNGYNVKHDDCNGDGIVDASDTTAVIANYTLIHPPYKLMHHVASGPPLTLTFTQDSIGNQSKAHMIVSLGTAANPANNVYGVALTVSIDTTIVKRDSTSMNIGSCWLGAGSTPFLHNLIENYDNSEVDFAFCRTDHNNVSGYGPLTDVEFTMKDDISGKINTYLEKILHADILRYKIIRANGDTMDVSPSGDTIKVTMLATENFVVNAQSEITGVYPNPADEFVNVKSGSADIVSVELYSLIGASVKQINAENPQKEITLNLQDLSRGVYLLKVNKTGSSRTIRIQVK